MIEAAALAGDWQSVDRRQRQRNADEKKKRHARFIANEAADDGEGDDDEEDPSDASDVDASGNIKGLLADEDSEEEDAGEEGNSDEEDDEREWVKEIVEAEVKAKTKRCKQRIEVLERRVEMLVKMLEGGGGAPSESGEEGTDAGPKRRRLRKGRQVVEDEELE